MIAGGEDGTFVITPNGFAEGTREGVRTVQEGRPEIGQAGEMHALTSFKNTSEVWRDVQLPILTKSKDVQSLKAPEPIDVIVLGIPT